MKVAYIVSSSYYIINMINLAINKHSGDYNVAYCLNHINESKEFFLRIKESGVFDEVYYMPKRIYINNTYKRFKQCFRAQRWLEKHLVKYKGKQLFDVIYSGSMTEIVTPLYQVSKNGNPFCKLIEVEDGLIYAVDYTDHYTWKSGVICKVLKRYYAQKEISAIMLYRPEMYVGKRLCGIEQMPRLLNSAEVKRCLNFVFGVCEEDYTRYLEYKFIFLGQAFEQKEMMDRNTYLYKIAKEVLKEKGLLLKPHPVQTNEQIKEMEEEDVVSRRSVSLEMIGININLSSKVLISMMSSAAFTSTVLFEQTPTLVLTYRLFREIWPKESINRIEKTVSEFKQQFKGAERKIFEPYDENEYLEILKSLSI